MRVCPRLLCYPAIVDIDLGDHLGLEGLNADHSNRTVQTLPVAVHLDVLEHFPPQYREFVVALKLRAALASQAGSDGRQLGLAPIWGHLSAPFYARRPGSFAGREPPAGSVSATDHRHVVGPLRAIPRALHIHWMLNA